MAEGRQALAGGGPGAVIALAEKRRHRQLHG
jgi:hypothetical protein